MKGLVLTGGFGTRLRPITYTSQKQLIPIANKPIVFYAIEDLVEAGITDIGVIYGPNKDQVMATIGTGERWGASITYIEQEYPKGLAHAVLIAKDFIGEEPFVMYLGDNLLKEGITAFVKDFQNSQCEASILLTHVKNPHLFGVAQLDDSGGIIRLIEKPKEPPSDLALVGIYAFRKTIFEAVRSITPSWRNELEITDAIQWLLDKGYPVNASITGDWWKDTGKPDDILEANHLVLDGIKRDIQGQIDDTAEVRGRIQVGPRTQVKEGTVLRGPLIIGEDCVIGPNTYIGPFTSIGNNVVIKNTEVESSIVMDDTVISDGERIFDSLIGRGCEISSSRTRVPRGYTLVLGDNSQIVV
ncbi:MAG: glucose-1-phosphate thymidylyltransferase [Theionarchaea archaeon]|nr:glucose-1-phosphate thymidylyltransferase [Theionarchaea archaeon]MBU6999618.1 glucose-1-phosphate thymidylyltransferase [Theionarchaea archaeon]MBU7020378.1 glucose-1-phosphate thymidylyltransferase [Theionarchaea archaeon]MBU7035326.1 glucose-1-phosphate thymidylyltransferase [Theionarchaea archaeon]